jgi:hypothetical protein
VAAPIPECINTAGDECQPVQMVVLCDDNGPFLRRYIINCNIGVITGSSDTELDGTTPYVPVGTVTLCDATCGSLRTTVICDLGATPQVQFQRSEILDCNGNVTTTIDQLADGTPYVPVGPLDFECDCLVCEDALEQFREHFEGVFTWVRPALVHMVTVKCRALDAPGSVTITDAASNTTPMFVGDEETWLGEAEPLVGTFQVDGAGAGDVVTILYTRET